MGHSLRCPSTRCRRCGPRERLGGRLQIAGIIPIPLSPTLCGPRRLRLSELGVFMLNTWEVRVPSSGGFWAIGEFQIKHTGPGTQGTNFAHHQSQFLARSLSLSVRKTVPKGLRPPGLDLSSQGGLVTTHWQVQVLAVPSEGPFLQQRALPASSPCAP